MKIHAHILCWNEEKILPFTLDHYSNYCEKIFLWDNESTDNSVSIAKKYPKVIINSFKTENSMDDHSHIKVKNFSYRKFSQDADYVFVLDCDEFIDSPKLHEYLEEYKRENFDVVSTEGHDMISTTFPEYGKPILDQIKYKFNVYNKSLIFNPKCDAFIGIGSHSYQSNRVLKLKQNSGINVYHCKFLSKDYYESRRTQLRERQSINNKNYGLNSHYDISHWDSALERAKEIKV